MAFNNKDYEKTYLTGGSTALIFTGKGTVHGVVVGTTAATAVVLYDGLAATSGTAVLLKASIVENSYDMDMSMSNGCYVTYGSGGTYTVIWTKP